MRLEAAEVLHDLGAVGDVQARNVGAGCAFEGVSTDSRLEVGGTLFVALRGERFDAHDFVRSAVSSGARGVLVDAATWPRWSDLECACFAVQDTLRGLQELARASLRRLPARLIAITGSNGKTTTKDLTVAALSTLGAVHGTQGNRNNHIGVPLTILARRGDEAFCVAEVGASDFGEIELLSQILEPEMVLITNVGRAHLARFGSLDGVLRAKSEIFAGLRSGGTAVLNADDPALPELVRRAGSARVVTFGFAPDADYRIESAQDVDGAAQELVVHGTRIRLQRSGRANAWNAAAAFCVAGELGGAREVVAASLESCSYTAQRSCWIEVGDVEVLDDTYNANPDSMLHALGLLGSRRGRRVAVLGDMLELGEASAALHAELGAHVLASGVQLLFVIGTHMQDAVRAASAAGLGDAARHFDAVETLVDALRAALRPGDAVLVKGSRGCRMERVVEALRAEVT
ncbi:MAG: UDP-N-acetylmuramoyl-tripeptide--D-alanyl-D-alanine ligase [Candidatus Krumholzibacteriia bacterium]